MRPAQHRFGLAVGKNDPALGVQRNDARDRGVHQTGQKVTLALQRIGERLAFRNVDVHARGQQGLAVIRPFGHPPARQDPHPMTVLVRKPKLVVEGPGTGTHPSVLFGHQLGNIVGVQQVGKEIALAAGDFFKRVAQHFRPAGVDLNLARGLVELPGSDLRALEHVFQTLFEGFLNRNVQMHPGHQLRLSIRAPAQDASARLHPDPTAVGVAQAKRLCKAFDLLRNLLFQRFRKPRAVARMQQTCHGVETDRSDRAPRVAQHGDPTVVDPQLAGRDVPLPGPDRSPLDDA